MKLVVGLGNPGGRYTPTRHNAGFWVVEAFARSCGIETLSERYGGLVAQGRCGDDPVTVLYPQAYMNRSGPSVASAVRDLGLAGVSQDLVVAVDDLDLPLGRLRLRKAGGAGGHRGMESLIEALETTEFFRLRFGIGRPPEGQDAVEYVLARLESEEIAPARRAVIRAAQAIRAVFCEGQDAAMSRFNSAETDSEPADEDEGPGSEGSAGSGREME